MCCAYSLKGRNEKKTPLVFWTLSSWACWYTIQGFSRWCEFIRVGLLFSFYNLLWTLTCPLGIYLNMSVKCTGLIGPVTQEGALLGNSECSAFLESRNYHSLHGNWISYFLHSSFLGSGPNAPSWNGSQTAPLASLRELGSVCLIPSKGAGRSELPS